MKLLIKALFTSVAVLAVMFATFATVLALTKPAETVIYVQAAPTAAEIVAEQAAAQARIAQQEAELGARIAEELRYAASLDAEALATHEKLEGGGPGTAAHKRKHPSDVAFWLHDNERKTRQTFEKIDRSMAREYAEAVRDYEELSDAVTGE